MLINIINREDVVVNLNPMKFLIITAIGVLLSYPIARAEVSAETMKSISLPDKGWNVIFRLYGPLEPFYDKTWRPGDPELVN